MLAKQVAYCVLFILVALFSTVVRAEGALYLWNRNYDTAPVNEVVELALSKTEDLYPAVTVIKSQPMEQDEAVNALLNGAAGISLMSMASSEINDEQFLVVKVPALKGLLGNRVCLIRKGGQHQFSNVVTAYDFLSQGIKVCQGTYWPDTDVLKRNGFPVVGSDVYQELFTLLRYGGCDCFLRGVQEVVPEWKARQSQFDIERRLLIRYPQPGFIYIPKSNPALATRIELGLLRAVDDGSYEEMFQELMGDNLAFLDIHSRTVIPINNPYVSPINKTVQKIKELWFSL